MLQLDETTLSDLKLCINMAEKKLVVVRKGRIFDDQKDIAIGEVRGVT